MKFDLNDILTHFCVERDQLWRRLVDGSLKPIRLVDRGKLSIRFRGKRHYGPEIAYACIYHVVPMYPIVQVDGNPHNMNEDNLMPVRLKQYRFRAVPKNGGFRHPLSLQIFPYKSECENDWIRTVKAIYRRDKPLVRSMEDEARGQVVLPKFIPKKRYARSERHQKPPPIEGRVWHRWKDDWLSVPLPVHISDDYMVRCRIVAEHPHAQFVYDPVTKRTLSVI